MKSHISINLPKYVKLFSHLIREKQQLAASFSLDMQKKNIKIGSQPGKCHPVTCFCIFNVPNRLQFPVLERHVGGIITKYNSKI